MSTNIILASKSNIRQDLLRNSGVAFVSADSNLDEEIIKIRAEKDKLSPSKVSSMLAQKKAQLISLKHKDALVIGCDQVLDFKGEILSKPLNIEQACQQLRQLRGKTHTLYSAACIFEAGNLSWQHVGKTTLKMHDFSDCYLEMYLNRNWPSIRYCVGSYKLEEEGARLFSAITGDYFVVLGMPLLEILSYLSERGILDS